MQLNSKFIPLLLSSFSLSSTRFKLLHLIFHKKSRRKVERQMFLASIFSWKFKSFVWVYQYL